QDLGDAPGLGDAAAREKGFLGVEDFADRADARLVEVRGEAIDQPASLAPLRRVELEPRLDVAADEPRPDRALVIGGIAGTQVAGVLRLVVGMVAAERAQAYGREQLFLHHPQHRLPLV